MAAKMLRKRAPNNQRSLNLPIKSKKVAKRESSRTRKKNWPKMKRVKSSKSLDSHGMAERDTR
jgi:hypothetical protein